MRAARAVLHIPPTTKGDAMASARAKTQDPSEREKRYYRIGEVSRITGVKPYVLRYWESEFRWMAPQKSRSQQRLYTRRDIEMVRAIKRLLWDEKFTIAGARKKLQELGAVRALDATQLKLALAAGEPRTQLARIRETLAEIRKVLA